MFVWVLALPGLACRLAAEVFALSLFLSCYVRLIAREKPYARMMREDEKMQAFKVMGFTTGFLVWFIVSMIFTILNGIDVVTDTLFSAVYSISLRCPANQPMRDVWTETFHQSMFGRWGIPTLDLATVIILCFVVCQLQALLPIALTIRNWEGDSLLTGETLDHQAVFDEMAEANGSASLQSLVGSKNFATCLENPPLAIGRARGAATTMAKRTWLSYVGENAVQSNLQTTLFGIAFHTANKTMTKATYQSLFSIGLGIGLTLLKLTDAMAFSKLSTLVEKTFEVEDEEPLNKDWNMTRKASLVVFRWYTKLIYAGFVVLVTALIYAAAKIFAAFYCDDSMMNLSGCVEL